MPYFHRLEEGTLLESRQEATFGGIASRGRLLTRQGWIIEEESLYGIRDAPANWEAAIKEVMLKIGFVQAKSTSCWYYHDEFQVRVEVHGDDFAAGGP